MNPFEEKYTYSFPTQIRFGKDVIDELPSHLKAQGYSSPLIVTDSHLRNIPFMKRIVDNLRANKINVEVYSDLHKNPIESDVRTGVEQFRKGQCDSIIAIGGGASMDVARAIALMIYHKGNLFDYVEEKGGEGKITAEIPYFITVPTTSGTGSEVGRSTVISDDETHAKRILFSPRLMARQVFADPGLTMDLPQSVTAATGMDALTHLIEAYLAKGLNPICDGIALQGLRLIGQGFVRAVQEPDFTARSQMMLAALMGAVAFQKGLGVVHSTAHPLSTLFDLHHGLANGIMLRFGVEFNAAACADRMRDIAEALSLKDPGADSLIEYLKHLNGQIELPNNLSSQGIKEDDIDRLAALAIEDVCHRCNPVPVTEADFKNIYRAAL